MSRTSARKAARRPAKIDSLVSGNVKIHGRRTSVRLEPEMWSALREIAEMEDVTIHDVCTGVDDCKLSKESFSSSLRVFLMKYYRDVALGGGKPAKPEADGKKEQELWPAAREAKEERSRREGQDARR